MNNVDFILSMLPRENSNTIRRCLKKATILERDEYSILVADDEWIYYYATSKPMSKIAYKFYALHQHLMVGKRLIAKNLCKYINHCTHLKGDMYLWEKI
jgi:hypothetical protein